MMKKTTEPLGPFFVELVYEKSGANINNPIAVAFVDGFANETDAWHACTNVRSEEIVATSHTGESIKLSPDQILQLFITKATDQQAFTIAAE